ncbi:MAG: ATP-binding protein, partial [Desulfonatronovibrio sp.]
SFHGRFRAFFKNPYNKQMDFRLSSSQDSLWVRCTGRIEDDVQHCSFEGQNCLLMAVNDVSQQVIAEKNLQESEERFKLLSDLTMEGVVIHKSGIVRDLNKSLAQMTGYKREALLGQNLLELLIHDEDKDIVKENIVKEYARPYVVRALRKNGEMFYAELEARNFPVGNEMLRVAAVRDITERKLADDKIKLINQKLEEANDQKEKLLSIIAHDLKSPMAGVFSISKLLAQDIQSLSQQEIKLISDEIHKSMENLMILLDDLLQWAQMSSERMEFSFEKIDIHKLAEPTLHTARDMAQRKSIKIQSEIPEDLFIVADKSMINTVIRNLIFNAIKFTNKDGNIFIKARIAESFVEVCIQDDGIGMEEKVLSTIFTVDKSKRQLGTEGEKGTGLGLVLCKDFVEKHGGRIWAESEPDKGTRVFFTLPGATKKDANPR